MKNGKVCRSRVVKVIQSCKTGDQLRIAERYASMAGLGNDPIVKEWLNFKRAINGSI